MKKQNKKIFAIIFALSLLLNIFTLSRCSDGKINIADKPSIIMPVEYEDTSIGNDNSGLIIEATSESIEDDSITLTATISPSDAENKEVDWSVAWKQGASKASQQVTNYVTVTPISEGSNIAKVRCLNAFPGDQIIIKVTTRTGGFSAECVCSYVGSPTGLSINVDDSLVEYDGDIDLDVVTLVSGQTYDFDLDLTSSFGEVDDSYSPIYQASHEGIGTFRVQFKTYSQAGIEESDVEKRTLDNYVNKTGGIRNYINYSIDGDKLHVEATSSLKSLVNIVGSGTGFTRGWYYYDHTGYEPYLKITVKETTSNISKSIYVRVVSSISGISLNKTTITF